MIANVAAVVNAAERSSGRNGSRDQRARIAAISRTSTA
jgi:hypothetical protein